MTLEFCHNGLMEPRRRRPSFTEPEARSALSQIIQVGVPATTCPPIKESFIATLKLRNLFLDPNMNIKGSVTLVSLRLAAGLRSRTLPVVRGTFYGTPNIVHYPGSSVV